MEDVKSAVSEVQGEVRLHEPMSRHTTMKIGGPADALVIPRSLEDLKTLVVRATKEGVPLFLLGGTNLIVRDGGIRGIVVKLSRLQTVRRFEDGLYAESGISFPKLSQRAFEAGLSGLEFACGIPGTLGGAIVMNAGAQEGVISDVLEALDIMDLEGKVKKHSRDELEFGYRSSRLPRGIVVGASLKLRPAPPEEIRRQMDQAINYRRQTQPLLLPNAGCIFKNPPGNSAGRLIDSLGLKGRRVGGAEVSDKHANFIVNKKNATAADVLSLIQEIQSQVKEATGIEMNQEVMIVGEDLAT
jgi:UDP-N-acetylmuramate dehydrogenase